MRVVERYLEDGFLSIKKVLVERGDTLRSIAQELETSQETLYRQNALKTKTVRPGQALEYRTQPSGVFSLL